MSVTFSFNPLPDLVINTDGELMLRISGEGGTEQFDKLESLSFKTNRRP
jgi:hypothetical protein